MKKMQDGFELYRTYVACRGIDFDNAELFWNDTYLKAERIRLLECETVKGY